MLVGIEGQHKKRTMRKIGLLILSFFIINTVLGKINLRTLLLENSLTLPKIRLHNYKLIYIFHLLKHRNTYLHTLVIIFTLICIKFIYR